MSADVVDGTRAGLVIVPLVTPMRPDGTPDASSMGRHIDRVIAAGVGGILALGSSGECVALSASQRLEVAASVIESTAGRVPVMLGVSTLGSTDAATEATALAALEPDSLLVAAPAGMRLSPTELQRHFRAVAGKGIPVIAYDVPSRVGNTLDPDMVSALATEGVIVGLKDSTGDLVKARRFADATRGIEGFARYTGCEEAIDASLLIGYDGAVPGLANVFPQLHVALAVAAGEGSWDEAALIQGEIVELLDLYSAPVRGGGFLAQFFGSVKEALRQLGVIEHSATSAVFAQPDGETAQHVAKVLERASAGLVGGRP